MKRKATAPSRAVAVCTIALLLFGCADWRFSRKLRPLLERDQKINEKYLFFEDSLPNDRHWTDNVQALNGMAAEKEAILAELEQLQPTEKYRGLHAAFVEDLRSSIAYLRKEAELVQRQTEYANWLARSLLSGSVEHAKSGAEATRAKQVVLSLQEELTRLAERANAAQGELERIALSSEMLRSFRAARYPRYMKGYVGFKIK